LQIKERKREEEEDCFERRRREATFGVSKALLAVTRSWFNFNPAGLGKGSKGVPCVDGPPMQILLLLQSFLF
jgi:hypothetical protein